MDQEKIGAFIAQCRKEAGYTQAALGEKLGRPATPRPPWERSWESQTGRSPNGRLEKACRTHL